MSEEKQKETEKSEGREEYDLVVIGTGPAGLTAGLYAGRYMLKTLILGEVQGGTITEAHKVCNFPSKKEIQGIELAFNMIDQVQSLGTEIKQEKVESIEPLDGGKEGFTVKTSKSQYKAKKVIIAVGRDKKELNISGEKEFLGKGVSYCATCDSGFFKDKTVSVIGGSDAALTAALLLAEHAKKVYIIYRREEFFRAEPTWVKQVKENEKIEPVLNVTPKEIRGEEKVESIAVTDNNTGEEKEFSTEGVFVEIGYNPKKEPASQLDLERTEEGYIKTNKKQETSLQGVYAAGDITDNTLKQVITAASEGAVAASSSYEEIQKEKSN